MELNTTDDISNVLAKIETIEKEVRDLKLTLLKKQTPATRKVIALRGILKGVDITDEDIESAQKSLYSKTGM